MALVAGHAAGMLGGNNLGEVSWLGRVFFVAKPAEVGDVGQFWHVRRGIVRVQRQGSMAGFAGYVSVLAGCPRFAFVTMAENAGVLPGVNDGPLPDQGKRAGPIMAVLSKSFGNNRAAHRQKDGQTGQQNQGRANQMTCVPHQMAHRSPSPREPDLCAGIIRWCSGNIVTNSPVDGKISHSAQIR
ncbi:MAG: hypothetical protein ABSH00_10130 [Bryobacteraceae bacterium]|jgi:hypothetical protein